MDNREGFLDSLYFNAKAIGFWFTVSFTMGMVLPTPVLGILGGLLILTLLAIMVSFVRERNELAIFCLVVLMLSGAIIVRSWHRCLVIISRVLLWFFPG